MTALPTEPGSVIGWVAYGMYQVAVLDDKGHWWETGDMYTPVVPSDDT